MTYKGMMLSDVPNFMFIFGYTNASWTLKADLSCEYLVRLLRRMDRQGAKVAIARRDPAVEEIPFLDFTSGYVQRALTLLPKQGARRPWRLYQNYWLDLLTLRFGKIVGRDAAAQLRPRTPCTALSQAATRADRAPASMSGAKVVTSPRTAEAASSSDANSPAPSPASIAAPKAVVSILAGRSTSSASKSARSCARKPLADMPPSIRSDDQLYAVGGEGALQLERLVGDGFERGADDVGAAGAEREAEDGAARIGVPMRRAEAGESGDDGDPGAAGHGARQRFAFRRRADQAELVAQPLHHAAGDEQGAFERIATCAAQLPGDGAEQAVVRYWRGVAGVGQDEGAGAVGRLGVAGREAGLADRRRLLVAGDAADRDGAAEMVGEGGAELAGAVADFRERRARHAEQIEQAFVPAAG